MESTLYIPEEIDEELSQLPYEDREIQGAFIFGDRERYRGQENRDDTFVASYVITGIGDKTSVTGDSEQIAALERLRQTTEFDYRMFHSHPAEAEREGYGRPDIFSLQDKRGTKIRQERVNNKNYFDTLIAPDRQREGHIYIISDSDVDIEVVENWYEDDGTGWREVEEEIDEMWDRIGGKVINPF